VPKILDELCANSSLGIVALETDSVKSVNKLFVRVHQLGGHSREAIEREEKEAKTNLEIPPPLP
jgi:hypothetical protein